MMRRSLNKAKNPHTSDAAVNKVEAVTIVQAVGKAVGVTVRTVTGNAG